MAASPHFQFVADLAAQFNQGAISLPSFPDIVVRIRKTLEKDDVSIDQVCKVVQTDPVLVSKLLVFANSSAHNPSGYRIDSLDVAISRLGFELVKNTAVSMAVQQMFLAEKHKDIAQHLRTVWQDSMQLSAMCSAVAAGRKGINEETAFLCGLLNYVGKLYIFTRAKNYPGFAEDESALAAISADWHPQIGKSIVESWGFSEAIAKSVDADNNISEYVSKAPTLVDVVVIAKKLLQRVNKAVAEGREPGEVEVMNSKSDQAALTRLHIEEEDLNGIFETFQEKLTVIREALTG